MKRFFAVSIVLFSVFSVFAYDDTDINIANSLASEDIIVDQSQSPAQYNLDAKILRQEVIGIALKIKWTTLPGDYTCKGYYSDTKQNDWVCRAIELAADDWVITRGNKTANPGKYITRAEALAMLMNAAGVAWDLSPDELPPDVPYTYDDANEWQYNLLVKAAVRNIVVNLETYTTEETGTLSYLIHAKFYPNREATRSEVFDFASKILAQWNTSGKYLEYSSPNDYTVEYENGMKTYLEDGIRYFEDADVMYTVAEQTMVCPNNTCTSTDFWVKTSFWDSTKILKTEHEETSNSDIYTVKITSWGSYFLWYIRIIPDFDRKIIYKLQALTAQENFVTQKERLQKFIQSIDIYQGN